jgi:hypothetical protein
MKILHGNASDILKDWAEGKYELYYKCDGKRIFQMELYEFETNTTFLPNEETEYFLEIILSD